MKYPSATLFCLRVLVKTGLTLADMGATGLRSQIDSNAGPVAETFASDGVRGPNEDHFPKESVLTGILEEGRPAHEGPTFSDGHEDYIEEGQALTWQSFTTSGKAVTYLRPFSEENNGYSERQSAPIAGIVCSGRYCDNKRLIIVRDGYSFPVQYVNHWTDFFSEHGMNYRDCPANMVVNEVQCRGRYCDDMRLQCGTMASGYRVTSNFYETAKVSEEQGERRCPDGYYVRGLKCEGSYCDNIRLRCVKVEYQGVAPPTKNYVADAARYAPIYKFDGSSSSYCYPDWPSVDNDYKCKTSMLPETPTFVQFDICGQHHVYTYWLWYGKQQQCAVGGKGEHGDDWEHVSVFVRNDNVDRVMYYQHSGWYTRRSGKYEATGDRPHVYIGKIGHGSYHCKCDGKGVIWEVGYCQSGCGYWDDMRNPSSSTVITDAYKLYDLKKGQTIHGIRRPDRDICPKWCEGSGSRVLTTAGCWQNDP